MSEHDEQAALIQWAQLQANTTPELALLFAIPNGGARHIAVARKLKAEGVQAGVPDLMLPVARGNFHGLFIEMKVKPNKVTPAQYAFLEKLGDEDYYTAVCYGFDEARIVLCNYLDVKP